MAPSTNSGPPYSLRGSWPLLSMRPDDCPGVFVSTLVERFERRVRRTVARCEWRCWPDRPSRRSSSGSAGESWTATAMLRVRLPPAQARRRPMKREKAPHQRNQPARIVGRSWFRRSVGFEFGIRQDNILRHGSPWQPCGRDDTHWRAVEVVEKRSAFTEFRPGVSMLVGEEAGNDSGEQKKAIGSLFQLPTNAERSRSCVAKDSRPRFRLSYHYSRRRRIPSASGRDRRACWW